MYVDDIKLFAKNEKELQIQIQAGRIYSPDIGMESGREKCTMLKMKNGEQQMTEGMELLNHENALRKGNLQILGSIWSGHHQTSGDERKKLKKNISGWRKSNSKLNHLAGTL